MANGPLLIGLLIRLSFCPVLWLHAGQWCVWWSKWMCLIVRKANRLAHLGAKCWHSVPCIGCRASILLAGAHARLAAALFVSKLDPRILSRPDFLLHLFLSPPSIASYANCKLSLPVPWCVCVCPSIGQLASRAVINFYVCVVWWCPI